MQADAASYFEDYSRFWHPVAFSTDVTDKPLPVTLLGREYLVWRANQKVHVTSRYCVHRGTDLAAGRLEADGLRCAFHGWKFGGDGRCIHIPSQPGGPIPDKARIASYLTTERYGLVWTCLSGEPMVPLPEWPQLEADRAVAPLPHLDWQTSAGRGIENMLDVSHLSWVHRPSFGNPNRPEVPPYDIERLPYGLKYAYPYLALGAPLKDGTRREEPCTGLYTLHAPFSVSIQLCPKSSTLSEHYFVMAASPVTIDRYRGFFFISYPKVFKSVIDRLATAEFNIQNEDRVHLEIQIDRVHRLDPSAEVHSEAEKCHVEYRRLLRELLARPGTSATAARSSA